MSDVTFTEFDIILVLATGVAVSVFLFIGVRRGVSALKRSVVVGIMFFAMFLIGSFLKYSELSPFFAIFAVFVGLLMTGMTYLACMLADKVLRDYKHPR